LFATSSCSATPKQLAKLDQDLRDYLETAEADEFVPVVIHLEGALGTEPAQRHQVLAAADGSTPLERRDDGRSLMIAALQQDFATRSTALMVELALLESRGSVLGLRKLFVLGAVACRIRKSALMLLIQDPALDGVGPGGIRLDLPAQVFSSAPLASHAAAKGALDSIAWGVDRIGADELTETGAGVLVAVIDAGFAIDHPDLQSRVWTNPGEGSTPDGSDTDSNGFVDDCTGWNFADDAGVFSGNSPHGTYVAGVVAGTGSDDPGRIRTGVAPGASLLLLQVKAGTGGTTQSEVWAALDYALLMKAKIVNLSSAWAADQDPDEASWRVEVDVLVECGVLFVTITGNDADQRKIGGDLGVYSPPWSVTIPGRVPSALTLGATDSLEELWYEAPVGPGGDPAGSNTGPVTWESVVGFQDYPDPPGLMKPDVVAPGHDIDVTYNAAQLYLQKAGTSLAAPHAAGLAALLLESDPNLGPFELRYAIEESALDLPLSGFAAGPDNGFGWGRIDAEGAMNVAQAIDSTDYDLAITATNSHWTSVDIWVDNGDDETEDTPVAFVDNHLYARVRNLGGQVVGNVRLVFYYADVSTIGTAGFDPDGDGDPSDGNFIPIGSYTVPLLGPSGSGHDEAVGLVTWNIPKPTGDHWCVGVAALADPPNAAELDTSNNCAFRNFFDLVIDTSGSMMFSLRPPQRNERAPFDFVVHKRHLPAQARLALAFDPALAPVLAKARPQAGAVGSRIELDEDSCFFRGVQLSDGQPVPLTLVVRVPSAVQLSDEARAVISVLAEDGTEIGGLTVRIRRDPSQRRVGPYPPKKVP
jgi:hypothetical protein